MPELGCSLRQTLFCNIIYMPELGCSLRQTLFCNMIYICQSWVVVFDRRYSVT